MLKIFKTKFKHYCRIVNLYYNNELCICTCTGFFGTLGLGPCPLELGKLATKLEFWEISHFNKPY